MTKKIKVVLDTNILMTKPNYLGELLQENEIIIPIVVIEELDHLKISENGRKAFQARKAIRALKEYQSHKNFKIKNNIFLNLFGKNDNKIISYAKLYNASIFSYDFSVVIKSRSKCIKIFEYESDGDLDYRGYKRLDIDTRKKEDEIILASIYEGDFDCSDLHVNEYLIIRDLSCPKFDDEQEFIDFQTIDILRFDGEGFVKLIAPPKRVIEPWNDLQRCTIDLLYNKNIPIKFVMGNAGTGKSKIATVIGHYLVQEKAKFNRMYLLRNIDNETIGYLSGGKSEKIFDSFKPIFQHLPVQMEKIEDMIAHDEICIDIPQDIKGLDINNSYLITDEAEDLNKKLIKRIGSRASENTHVVFLGDYTQAEDKFLNNNGLLYASERMIDNPLAGTVVMDLDVRSSVSQAFSEI